MRRHFGGVRKTKIKNDQEQLTQGQEIAFSDASLILDSIHFSTQVVFISFVSEPLEICFSRNQ